MSPFQTSLCAVMFVNCMLETWLFYGCTSEDQLVPFYIDKSRNVI